LSGQQAIFFIARQTRQNANKAAACAAFFTYPQGLTWRKATSVVLSSPERGHRAPRDTTARPGPTGRGPLPFTRIQTKGTPPCSKRS
jgi:hypothetical protein